jgi:hypothetical protein
MTSEADSRGGIGVSKAASLACLLPALGFGIPTPFVLASLRRTGELPMTPFGFRSHAGGPLENLGVDGFVVAGWLFVGACLVDAVAAAWLWQGRRRGALLGLAMTPIQLAFAIGFAFPFLLLAIPIRLALTAAAWPKLR